MANCTFCTDLLPGFTPADGYCEGTGHNNVYVCTAGRRKDPVFHGERCACGCLGLFCLAHAREHATGPKHNSTLANCFSGLALSLAGAALGESARTDSEISAKGKRSIADFLQHGEPGWKALFNRRTIGESSLYRMEESDWPIRRLMLQDEFFNATRLERVAALAARTARRALRNLSDSNRLSIPGEMRTGPRRTPVGLVSKALRRTFDMLGLRMFGFVEPRGPLHPSVESLIGAFAMLGKEAPPGALDSIFAMRTQIPEDSDEIALWLVGPEMERETIAVENDLVVT